MTTAELIKKLQTKPQEEQIEYIIVSTKGKLIACQVEAQVADFKKFLKSMFPDK